MAGRTKGICQCGNVQTSTGVIDGRRYYSRYCSTCKKSKYSKNRKLLKNSLICQICGFQAKHQAQLDVDHIDGNHENNDLSNLQIICANCHRLKTIEEKDYLKFQHSERIANKWVGRNARDYLRSIGFKVSVSGAYSKEMLEALEKAGIPRGTNYYLAKRDFTENLRVEKKLKTRKNKK